MNDILKEKLEKVPEEIMQLLKNYASKKYEITDTSTFSYLQQDACIDGCVTMYHFMNEKLAENAWGWIQKCNELQIELIELKKTIK